MVLGTDLVSRNYLKISHEITTISELAGSLWDSTTVPVYEYVKSRNKYGCIFWDFQVHAARPELGYSISFCLYNSRKN